MPDREQIRELILGAAEGATGSLAALESIGSAAAIEDFDVEVVLGGERAGDGVCAVVRFSIVVGDTSALRRSVA